MIYIFIIIYIYIYIYIYLLNIYYIPSVLYTTYELSRSRLLIVIIIMSEFKVGRTYLCTNSQYTHYKIFYSNTRMGYEVRTLTNEISAQCEKRRTCNSRNTKTHNHISAHTKLYTRIGMCGYIVVGFSIAGVACAPFFTLCGYFICQCADFVQLP